MKIDPNIKKIVVMIVTNNVEYIKKKRLFHGFNLRMELPNIMENKWKILSLIQCFSFYGSYYCSNFCYINELLISNEEKESTIMGGNTNIELIFKQNGVFLIIV